MTDRAPGFQHLRARQRDSWQNRRPLTVEDLLRGTEASLSNADMMDLIRHEIDLREELEGRAVNMDEYVARFPKLEQELRQLLRESHTLTPGASTPESRVKEDTGQLHRVEAETNPWSETPNADALQQPNRIGRYRVDKTLGRGGFGVVYQGYDESLDRPVAIKVAFAQQFDSASQLDLSLKEARTVAGLEHPAIVPIYDVGQSDPFPFFIVSKLIEGNDLASEMQARSFSTAESVELIVRIAEALHFAHQRGCIHRDVKPGNILLDSEGSAYLADFGLALHDDELGEGANWLGTPAYMSPEQASGMGHRVDGRSDIFSLGVVLYELLAGKRPFRSESQVELLEQITSMEPRPPRQLRDTIPPQLEEVCLKALSKSVKDRFSTAGDFAQALAAAVAADDGATIDQAQPPLTRWSAKRTAVTVIGATLVALIGWWLLPQGFPDSRPDNPVNQVTGIVPSDGSPSNKQSTTKDTVAKDTSAKDIVGPVHVRRFDVLVARDANPFHSIRDVRLPLKTYRPERNLGDRVRFVVELSAAAFARLLWIDAQGQITELFPSDTMGRDRPKAPVRRFQSPEKLDEGWPLTDPGGRECAVLLIKTADYPKSPGELSPLPLAGAPLRHYWSQRSRGLSQQAEWVSFAARGLGKKSVRVGDPFASWLTQRNEAGAIVEAISILHSDTQPSLPRSPAGHLQSLLLRFAEVQRGDRAGSKAAKDKAFETATTVEQARSQVDTVKAKLQETQREIEFLVESDPAVVAAHFQPFRSLIQSLRDKERLFKEFLTMAQSASPSVDDLKRIRSGLQQANRDIQRQSNALKSLLAR